MMDTVSDILASDFDSIHSEDIKHVWYFQPILEHTLFSFVICHASSSNKAHVLGVCCDGNDFKVGSVWSSVV